MMIFGSLNEVRYFVALPCPVLNLTEHLVSSQQKMAIFRFNEHISLKCEDGYELIGKGDLKCIFRDNDTQWSNEPPNCRGKLRRFGGLNENR